MMNNQQTLHASAVAIDGKAVIITGLSASGKSDLAYRLIDRGATLIADDSIIIDGSINEPIICQSKHHISAIELRGVGIIPMPCVNNIPFTLAVEIVDVYERSPNPLPIKQYGQYNIPLLKISPFEHSAPLKVEAALRHINIIIKHS